MNKMILLLTVLVILTPVVSASIFILENNRGDVINQYLNTTSNVTFNNLFLDNDNSAGTVLRVQGAAAQSADLTTWEDATGTELLAIEDNGQITSYDRLLLYGRQDGATAYGMSIVGISRPSSGAGAATQFNPYIYPQANLANAYGVIRLTRVGAYAGTSYNLTQLNNVFDRIDILNDNRLVNAFNYKIASPNLGGGSIGNLYGLYVQDMTKGDVSNYPIYTNAGTVSFGDDIEQRSGNATINLLYGEMSFNNDTGETLAIGAQDTYYNVTLLEKGLVNGFTYLNGSLTALQAGTYKVDYSISFGGGANDEYHMAIGVNGAEQVDCHNARLLGAGGDLGNAGGTCIIALSSSDKVSLMVENEDDADDMTIQDGAVNLLRIGS